MRMAVISAALPPQVNGIGDYTARIAEELAKSVTVSILTAQGHAHTPIANVPIFPVFRADQPASVKAIAAPIQQEKPDWILLQYNPFSYGAYGLNLHLPHILGRLRKKLPATRLAVMVHEPFVPPAGPKNLTMSTWQRWQLWQLGRTAHVMFFSIDVWAQRFRRWFPHTSVHHLPVGSSIPQITIAREEARQRLGIAEGTLVLGLFGTAHVSRLLNFVQSATQSVCRTGQAVVVLYMGPHGPVVREALGGVPLIAEGPLPAEEISRRFAAIDINLSPYSDGVSTRRTAMMTALQHGIATVGTDGLSTDAMLREQNGKALLLAEATNGEAFSQQVILLASDTTRRTGLGLAGHSLYRREFAWDKIGKRLLDALATASRR